MPKHFLSICAVVRNEAPYIAEWMEFHRMQGVEHFYIYHNAAAHEDDPTFTAIWQQIDKHNDITVQYWPGTKQQCKCYQDCLDKYGEESEWIAFIDVDEFLWSPQGNDILLRFLKGPGTMVKDDVLGIAAIAVHWMLFGSNGHKEKTDGLVIERFTRRAAGVNNHVKSIVRPANIESTSNDPHAFLAKPGYCVVNERGVCYPRQYANSERGEADILQCVHMHTKSLNEFISRKSKAPDSNSGRTYNISQIKEKFDAHDCNEIEDTRLKDLYAEKIKAVLHL